MNKAIVLLIACFSLLLGLVLMDASYTGHVVQDIDITLYDGTNMVFAFTMIVGLLLIIGMIYHEMNKPLVDHA